MINNGYEAIKDLHRERRTFAIRASVAGAIGLLLVAVLTSRMVILQIFEHAYYSTRADGNRMRLLPIPPVRGLIYDRSGTLLAQNQPSFQLEISPEQVGDLNDTLKRLAALVKLDDNDLQHFRERLHRTPSYRSVVLRSNLTPEEVARFEVDRYQFTGVELTAGLLRDYPLGATTSHVLGYVGGISDADYAMLDENLYQGLNQIGKSGIERSHEDELRGTPGSRVVEANAGGRPLRDLDTHPGVAGRNLYLSLDAHLQAIAEQALGDLDGAVVAIDPRNGEILAMVSKPGFDPHLFVEGIDTKTYHALLQDQDKPLYNRALLGTYPPGSTIKPFIATAALQYNTLNPDDRVYCSGTYFLPNSDRKYRCWQRHGHGPLDLVGAIMKSCDVYFYQAALNLGIDRMDDMLAQYGFGKPTGVDEPSEKGGLLPSREWKRAVRHQAWYPGETIITGIGQGYMQVTMLQMAQAVMRLCMHGGGYKPHLVHAIGDPQTGAVQEVQPEPLPQITVRDPAVFDKVIYAMQQVNQTPGGTAYHSFGDAPYTSGGKTGTAQVAGLSQEDDDAPKIEALPMKLRDHALYVAFAPVDAPRIVVAGIAEHAGHGGSAVAPIARELIDQWLLGKVVYHAPNLPPVEPADTDTDNSPDDTSGAPADSGSAPADSTTPGPAGKPDTDATDTPAQ